MKRRDFVSTSAGVAALLIPGISRSALPCPPPQVSVVGGTSAATNCTAAKGYATNFPATENPINEGGAWINGRAVGLAWNNMQTTPAKAFGTTHTPSSYADNIAHLSGFSSTQSAQAIVYRASGYNPSTNHEIELLLRFSITANNARGYELTCSAGGASGIVRWNGAIGSFQELSTSGPGLGSLANGDVIKFEAIGSKLNAYRNGTLVLSATDSTWADGNPGIGAFSRGGDVVLSNYGWSSFIAN